LSRINFSTKELTLLAAYLQMKFLFDRVVRGFLPLMIGVTVLWVSPHIRAKNRREDGDVAGVVRFDKLSRCVEAYDGVS
jgi:hypothetical protein